MDRMRCSSKLSTQERYMGLRNWLDCMKISDNCNGERFEPETLAFNSIDMERILTEIGICEGFIFYTSKIMNKRLI
jgi:hypothetical protein